MRLEKEWEDKQTTLLLSVAAWQQDESELLATQPKTAQLQSDSESALESMNSCSNHVKK